MLGEERNKVQMAGLQLEDAADFSSVCQVDFFSFVVVYQENPQPFTEMTRS